MIGRSHDRWRDIIGSTLAEALSVLGRGSEFVELQDLRYGDVQAALHLALGTAALPVLVLVGVAGT